jgi:hypothetical protein
VDRKTLVTAAGAVALTVVAASSAMAVNLGILDSSRSDGAVDLVEHGTTAGVRSSPGPASTSGAPSSSVRDGGAVTGAPVPSTAVSSAGAPAPAARMDDGDDDDDEREDHRGEHRVLRPGRDDDD